MVTATSNHPRFTLALLHRSSILTDVHNKRCLDIFVWMISQIVPMRRIMMSWFKSLTQNEHLLGHIQRQTNPSSITCFAGEHNHIKTKHYMESKNHEML